MRSYYCFFEDPERRRTPAFDTDIAPAAGEEGLARLRESCESCTDEHPELTCIIVDDESWETVDVFGALLREQYDSIDWNEGKERERNNAFLEEEDMSFAEDPPVPF
jgi:hypothetical protein